MQFLSCRSSRLLKPAAFTASVSASVSLINCCSIANATTSTREFSATTTSTSGFNRTRGGGACSSFQCCSASASSSAVTLLVPLACTAMRTTVQEVRPGDWLCANCGENNFRFRTHCNLCSKARSPGQEGSSGSFENAGDESAANTATTSAGTPTIKGLPGRSSRDSPNATKGMGDWTCPVCQSLNFKFRSECFSCREARPASERPPKGLELTEVNMKPGDWKCPECNGINFRGRGTCFTCRSPRMVTNDVANQAIQADMRTRAGRGGGGGGAGPIMKKGDWLCQSCSEHNFADRPSCFRCGQPRGDAKGYQPRGSSNQQSKANLSSTSGAEGKPANSTSLTDQVMEGDWMCIECGVNNFRRRSVCVKCKTAKAGGDPNNNNNGNDATAMTKEKEAAKEASKIADPLSDDF